MVTHPSGSHYQDSISNLLAAYFREKNETTRIRSIGRLDKETSGILLFARNQVAAARLQKQREEGKLQKKYLALAEGDLSEANDSVFWKENCYTTCPGSGKSHENDKFLQMDCCQEAGMQLRIIRT